MKYSILCAILLLVNSIFAQHHDIWAGYSNYIFVENANVRSAPSLDGKVIGTLKHNTPIVQDYTKVGESDTIAGVSDFWLPIKFQNTTAFIWSPVLAQDAFSSELLSKKTFLFKFSATRNAEFKIFADNQLYQQYSFSKKLYTNAVSWNMGKTFNSNGNELIVVKYYNDTLSGYELYEWNGEILKLSKIKLIDDSFITEKYIDFKKGIINTYGVNLREAPDSKSASLTVLPKNTQLEVVGTFYKSNDNSLNEFGFWHKVKWKGKVGYVWSEYFDLPYKYIRSNLNPKESFLLTNNAVYAFENRKIVSRVNVGGQADDDFHLDGSKGFTDNYQFLAICMRSDACGEIGGDYYLLWKDLKLSSVGCDCGSGDGGYSGENSIIFPNSEGGIKDKLLFTEESYVYDVSNEEGEGSYTSNESTMIKEFRNDSLVEVPSEHLTLRTYLSKNFPYYSLMHYDFMKLNGDTLADVMFFLHPKNEEEGASKIRPLVGYALKDSLGNYLPPVSTSQIVLDEYFSVKFTMVENVLKIRVKYGLYPDGESEDPYFTDYNYKFDPLLNTFVWYSISCGHKVSNEEEKFKWGEIKTSYFKSRKIKFENTWNFYPDGYPQSNAEEDRGE